MSHPPPPISDAVPPEAQRLQQLNNIWSVKQCPHCHTIWNRDVNACRYLFIEMTCVLITFFILEILVSFTRVSETIMKDLPYSERLIREKYLKKLIKWAAEAPSNLYNICLNGNGSNQDSLVNDPSIRDKSDKEFYGARCCNAKGLR